MNMCSNEINRKNYEYCKFNYDTENGNTARWCNKYFSREDYRLYEEIDKLR
jgi:hypothetical protein